VNNNNALASRHPDLVLIYEQEEDILGAATIIGEQVDDYRSIPRDRETAATLKRLTPAVIILALGSVPDSVKYYAELVEKENITYPHYSILLCKNRESGMAFRCCIKGLFDNYFVHQPLYEKFRLKMIIHNGLMHHKSTCQYAGMHEEQFEQIDQDLAALIDQSSEQKHQLLTSIDDCKQDLRKAAANIEKQTIEPQLSPKQLMEQITRNHVEPLLATLEKDIKCGLDNILQQMADKQLHHQEAAQQAAQAKMVAPLNSESINQALTPTTNDNVQEQAGLLEEPGLPSMHILVVEDNEIYRNMLVKVLVKEGFEVDEAVDGLKALQKIKEQNYDVVLMDLFMPNLDGVKTTKQLKKLNGGKDIPVIALTGNKKKELVREWAALGLKGYLVKPSTRKEILSALSKATS